MKKNVTKVLSLLLVFSMILSGSLFLPQTATKVQAASGPSLNSFGFYALRSDNSIVDISIDLGSSGQIAYGQVALCSAKGKILAKAIGFRFVSFENLKQNRLYYYKVRSMTYDSSTGTYTPASGWSKSKAFSTAKVTTSLVNKKGSASTLVFKFPKVTGIKNYRLYISTSENSGYKKVATVQAGKSCKVNKVNGKSITINRYYYKYVPVTTSGQSCRGLTDCVVIFSSKNL